MTTYELMSIVPPPASTINTLFPGCRHVRRDRACGNKARIKPGTSNLQVFTGQSVSNTKVETGLPFSHEMDSTTSLRRVRDDSRSNGSSPEMALLRTPPTVGMGQDELDLGSHRVPLVLSDFVGGDEEHLRRIEQVTHEIREDVDDRFPLRELFAHLILQGLRGLCGSQQKLPPANCEYRGRQRYLGPANHLS